MTKHDSIRTSGLWYFAMLCPMLLIPASASLSVTKSDYSKIINRKIFADPVPPRSEAVKSILKPQPAPSLESLIGLKGIMFDSEGNSIAIVELKEKKTEIVLAEGEVIENAYLKKINEFDVEFSYDGRDIKLSLPKPATGSTGILVKDTQIKVLNPKNQDSSTTGATFVPGSGSSPTVPLPQQPRSINLNEITEKIRSDPSLLASVSVTPFIQDGKVEGFVVNRVPETGISAQLGIQPGDVIKRINGTLIDSLSRAYAVYNNIISSQTKIVTVEVIRGGQPIILTYKLE